MDYQAKLTAPFGVLGIRCDADALTGIEFLAPDTVPCVPRNALAKMACEQLLAYFDNPSFHFNLPLRLNGTAHQTKVWQAMCAIPRGETRSYGELAAALQSSAQAVGQACGANPIPIVIPCHRVVGKAGLGGFMHHSGGYALDIKRWLLAHEGVAKPESVIDRTTSHSTKLASEQAAGYPVQAGKQAQRSFEERPSSPIKALDSGSSPERQSPNEQH